MSRLPILLLATTAAWCSPIYISNFSFESPALDGKYYTTGSATRVYSADDTWHVYTPSPIPGWNIDANEDAGVWNPAGWSPFSQPLPDGSQVAYSNGGRIWQVLNVTLQPYTTYTLNVGIGNRQDCCADAGYRVSLYAGSTEVAFDNSSLHLVHGTWGISTVVFATGATNPLFGQLLTIMLQAYPSFPRQVDFDDVTLDATLNAAIPEPSSALLIAGGAAVLWLSRRRRTA